MNFEKIEIIGFKSFADKVVLTFDNGVTGIVGPNGCGKSNIADAIKWVLGEQSAKSLRGTTMSDVIFNGTQSRKSLSFCEVSLYFDNSNKLFPSSDYTEVILTRKLFRDGTSEYFVNKQPARMRDIINLLHECGVSKSGYSIIGQGKVSEILSSKPEDRRAIFEEAVGIAKSKSDKLDNERKLERTRGNISRIVDLTTELEKQLSPAARAAEKAKRSFELQEELKYNEINNYLFKHDNASTTKDRINLRIQGINEEIALREKELENSENAYRTASENLIKTDELIEQLNQTILEESVKQERSEGQTKVIQEKISALKSDSVRLNNETEERRQKIELLEKAIDAKNQASESAKAEIQALEKEAEELSDKLVKIIADIQAGESLAQTAQSKILASADAMADMSRNIGSLDTEKTVLSSQQKELMEKVSVLSETYGKLTLECERIKADISVSENSQKRLQEEISDTEANISAANNKISELANKIYKLNMELSSLETNHKIYTNLKESYEGYPQSVKNLMATAKQNKEINSKIKGVVASLIKTDPKFEIAIETALGSAVQNIVTATPDDAQYLIEYLKRSRGGRVTFLPVSSVKQRIDSPIAVESLRERGALGLATKIVRYEREYERVIQFLLGNTLVVDNIENATAIAKKTHFAFKIVTLDGDVLATTGQMSGGSQKQNQAAFLSTDNKLGRLAEQIAQTKAEIERLNREKDRETELSNSLVDELDRKNEALQTARPELSALKEKLRATEELAATCSRDIKENSDSAKKLGIKLDDISRKFEDIERGNRKLKEEKDMASDDAQKHQSMYDGLKAERDKLSAKRSETLIKLSTLNADLKSTLEDIERMNGERTECFDVIERNDAAVAEHDAAVAELYDKITSITSKYEETSGIKELREKLTAAQISKARINDTIKQEDLRKQGLASEISKKIEQRHDEETRIARVDTELEYMQQRVQEAYNYSYEDCLDLRDPEYDFSTSQIKIDELRNKLRNLGAVNPTAVEDYEALKSRYDELMIQRDDLEKAEDDIKQAIKKLTDEMLATFNDGFNQIREHFKLIFKQLFGGGRADLILDYASSEDPLEAGVEIVAEPPGKKLQKISLLSGGEMSLTAIAILFAILKLRPMPFCVLDEIEAALDDANVERFARYLQNFSKETQFIVITHKKVTMELSDALFGVTMQEKGVSKIVSVKLADIENVVDFD